DRRIGQVLERDREKFPIGRIVPHRVTAGVRGQGNHGRLDACRVSVGEGGRLGGLQIGGQIGGDRLQVILPEGRVARRFARRVPHHLLHFRDAANLPQARQQQEENRQADGQFHRR